jgi:hypothetical protein
MSSFFIDIIFKLIYRLVIGSLNKEIAIINLNQSVGFNPRDWQYLKTRLKDC